jgi:hypothetical protein
MCHSILQSKTCTWEQYNKLAVALRCISFSLANKTQQNRSQLYLGVAGIGGSGGPEWDHVWINHYFKRVSTAGERRRRKTRCEVVHFCDPLTIYRSNGMLVKFPCLWGMINKTVV